MTTTIDGDIRVDAIELLGAARDAYHDRDTSGTDGSLEALRCLMDLSIYLACETVGIDYSASASVILAPARPCEDECGDVSDIDLEITDPGPVVRMDAATGGALSVWLAGQLDIEGEIYAKAEDDHRSAREDDEDRRADWARDDELDRD